MARFISELSPFSMSHCYHCYHHLRVCSRVRSGRPDVCPLWAVAHNWLVSTQPALLTPSSAWLWCPHPRHGAMHRHVEPVSTLSTHEWRRESRDKIFVTKTLLRTYNLMQDNKWLLQIELSKTLIKYSFAECCIEWVELICWSEIYKCDLSHNKSQ